MSDFALRRHLLETARGMNASGINKGMSGNVSTRTETGFLITPSGMSYDVCTPRDMVPMDLGGNWRGSRKPSSEWRFHRDIYLSRPEAGAVLHAHSAHATALACLSLGIPPFHYMVAMAGGKDIRCAPYAVFGSQDLSDHALNALQDRKACLLAHHGLLCLEQDLTRVLALAVEVENLAGVYARVRSMATPELLTDAQMQEVIEKFRTYGANTL